MRHSSADWDARIAISMHQVLDFARVSAVGISAAAAMMGQAHALLIVPTFDTSITTNRNAAALEAAINTAVSTIDGLYSNPGTVQVLFQFNSNVFGQSQDGGGSDYGDFANTAVNIQDAFYPGTTNLYSTLSPDYAMLLSIGYDPLPEPSTLALVISAAGGLGWMRRRRVRRA